MSGEGEDAVDNDIESESQQTNSSKARPYLPRAATKPIPEISETDVTHKAHKRDSSPVDCAVKQAVPLKPATTSSGLKTRRPWELWSVEDKNAFLKPSVNMEKT
ncbi:hypothetical protein CEXT_408011 [Caerostris extrusa]|uniref:Uncharacterized protein n=1 Tax=Caerostris extrusa TaxID=172846 RepID=A0AAV4YCM2_CAEEX|nr:hypothetical protein CEXT_408011 [Caerostris extrusa]